ncbi:MAG: DUF5807 family protein [Haloarculaceae archaeon]
MTAREEFLAGDRLEDVLVYLSREAVGNPDALADHAEEVPGGLVLVVPGEEARSVFQQAAGVDPMAFAREAGGTEGDIAADLTGATCPEQDGEGGGTGASEDHEGQFVFAFAEAENQDAGGLYADGDVIHAYASCSCGASYSTRWIVGDR